MNEDYTSLQEQISTLQETLQSLMENTTMPKEFVEAMRIRLLKTTGKLPSSVTVVTTVGGGLFVCKPLDGFIKLKDGKNIPYFYD